MQTKAEKYRIAAEIEETGKEWRARFIGVDCSVGLWIEPSHTIDVYINSPHAEIGIKPEPEPVKLVKPIKGDILLCIEFERAYQEGKWPNSHHTVGEWLLILDKLMGDAKRAWVTGSGNSGALHEVRQIVATGIACMEQCGFESRQDWQPCSKPA